MDWAFAAAGILIDKTAASAPSPLSWAAAVPVCAGRTRSFH